MPGIRRIDGEFSDQALVEAIHDNYPVLHLATHFHFAPGGTDRDSFLLLGGSQKLTLEDFEVGNNYEMKQVDLLTLSACDTALGEVKANGNEVEGLAALVQQHGAKAVLATLWSVVDGTTGPFMATFYEDRQQHQLTKAEALRQTQVAFIHGTVDAPGLPLLVSQGQGAKAKSSATKQTVAPNGSAVRIDAPSVAVYQPDPKAPFAHPFYWAPFILMGNWL